MFSLLKFAKIFFEILIILQRFFVLVYSYSSTYHEIFFRFFVRDTTANATSTICYYVVLLITYEVLLVTLSV